MAHAHSLWSLKLAKDAKRTKPFWGFIRSDKSLARRVRRVLTLDRRVRRGFKSKSNIQLKVVGFGLCGETRALRAEDAAFRRVCKGLYFNTEENLWWGLFEEIRASITTPFPGGKGVLAKPCSDPCGTG